MLRQSWLGRSGTRVNAVQTRAQRLAQRRPVALCSASARDFFVAELQLSADDVDRSLHQHPELHHVNIAARARPVAECLKAEAHTTPEDLGRILLRHPQVFGYSLEDRVQPVLQFLRDDVQLKPAGMRTFVTRFPVVFSYGVKAHLRPQLAYLCSLGVSAAELPGLVVDRPLVLGEGIDLVISYIKAQGVPRQQISRLLRSYPIDYRLHLRGQGVAQEV